MALMLYNFAIWGFRFLLKVLSPVHGKARNMVRGRRQWQKKLRSALKDHPAGVAWFHCASLGEFEQGRPLIDRFHRLFPQQGILLTFFSPSGYEVRKNYPKATTVQYLPWDTAGNARAFFEIARPSVIFFIKYEFWYHFLAEAQKRDIPAFLCSAVFYPNQVFFKPYGALHRKIITFFQHIFVQNAASKELLYWVDGSSVTVSGDTRIDRVAAIAREASRNELVESFAAQSQVVVVGSSWPKDMELLAPFINQTLHFKFIIAPHQVSSAHINHIERLLTRPCIRYSAARESPEGDILIIDTVGILSHLYQYGHYAYIGGAFGTGLHNILEPATFGLPLFFGNRKYQKFTEARDLVKLGAAFPVASTAEISGIFKKLNDDPALYQQIRSLCSNYIMEHQGATDIIIEHTKMVLNKRHGSTGG